MLADALRRGGAKTGAYFSPWLRKLNETVQIDGNPVTDTELVSSFAAVERARGTARLTPFEFQTLAALHLFTHMQVDIAVLEVGLGGARDAVNVANIEYALLTNVGLDHLDWLGPDRESIGEEKAAIFRRSRPAVCADRDAPATVLNALADVANPGLLLGRDFQVERSAREWLLTGPGDAQQTFRLPYGLDSSYGAANAAGVLVLLDQMAGRFPVAAPDRRAALQTVLPGRQECRKATAVLPQRLIDISHNVEAGAVLAERLKRDPVEGTTVAVLAMLRDKNVEGYVNELAPYVSQWFIAGNPDARGLSAQALRVRCMAVLNTPVNVSDTIEEAYQKALAVAGPSDRLLACGSFACVRAVSIRDDRWQPEGG
jgi:dihydrofolate synthase/folylpolyglutamate synthase